MPDGGSGTHLIMCETPGKCTPIAMYHAGGRFGKSERALEALTPPVHRCRTVPSFIPLSLAGLAVQQTVHLGEPVIANYVISARENTVIRYKEAASKSNPSQIAGASSAGGAPLQRRHLLSPQLLPNVAHKQWPPRRLELHCRRGAGGWLPRLGTDMCAVWHRPPSTCRGAAFCPLAAPAAPAAL